MPPELSLYMGKGGVIMKKIVSVLICLLMLFTVTSAFAADIDSDQVEEIQPMYVALKNVSATLYIANGTAQCTGSATALSNDYTINMTMKLQVDNNDYWETIGTWTGSGVGLAGISLYRTKSGLVPANKDYRVHVVATVYKNSKLVENAVVDSPTFNY